MTPMSSDVTPFKGHNPVSVAPTRVLRRFMKGGRVAEIHERNLTSFTAVEFMILIDGALRESQMLHGRRLQEYAPALAMRVKQLTDLGWIEERLSTDS